MRRLDELFKEYDQALQNFEWAEKDYVRDAIIDLYALEMLISKALKRAKRG